jgi:hypothetical protein
LSITASFWGSKVRKKIIREKSKIYKNSQNAIKIKKQPNYLVKKCLVMRIGWKMHYLQPITWFYDFFLCKTKIFPKFIKPAKKIFWPKQKNRCLMILNDKPKFQGFWWTLVQFCPILQRMTFEHSPFWIFQRFSNHLVYFCTALFKKKHLWHLIRSI